MCDLLVGLSLPWCFKVLLCFDHMVILTTEHQSMSALALTALRQGRLQTQNREKNGEGCVLVWTWTGPVSPVWGRTVVIASR